MKEKYIFLLGFGVGVVFTSFLGFFVYNLSIKANFQESNISQDFTNLFETQDNTE